MCCILDEFASVHQPSSPPELLMTLEADYAAAFTVTSCLT